MENKVSTDEKFLDINIEKAEQCKDKVILCACASGKPAYVPDTIDGVERKIIEVNTKSYIPE